MTYCVTYTGFWDVNIYTFTDLAVAKQYATSLKDLRHVTDIKLREVK